MEFALVLPLFLLLVFGIVECGRVFHAYLVIAQAAREGARAGAVGGSDEAILEAVREAAATLDVGRLSVAVDPPAGARVPGESVKVEVSYAVPLVTPLLADIFPNPFPLEAEAVMRVE